MWFSQASLYWLCFQEAQVHSGDPQETLVPPPPSAATLALNVE